MLALNFRQQADAVDRIPRISVPTVALVILLSQRLTDLISLVRRLRERNQDMPCAY
jgi:hypothetical protein